MVRSNWIGPVFGMLALTGLARGQTTPSVPPTPGEAQERIITVQEAGKPAQRCKVLKMWTEPDGTLAYQAQALDTGEMMTIEKPAVAAPGASGPLRSVAMRVLPWGRSPTAPVGIPEPPPSALVVGSPKDMTPTAAESPRVVAGPAAAPKQWPTAFVSAAPAPPSPEPRPTIEPLPPAAPVAKKVELTPIQASPVVSEVMKAPMAPASRVVAKAVKPTQYVTAPAWPRQYVRAWPTVPTPSPYASQPTNTPIAVAVPQPTPTHVLDNLPKGSPYAAQGTPAPHAEPEPGHATGFFAWVLKPAEEKVVSPEVKPAPVVKAKPPEIKPTPAVAMKLPDPAPVKPVEDKPAAPPVVAPKVVATTTPPPPDWRQSWGKVDQPSPSVAAGPPPRPDLPHAEPRADDPLKTPDKYAQLPHDFFNPDDKPAPDKRAPFLAALAMEQKPGAPSVEAKAPLTAPMLPPLPGPQAASKAAPVTQTTAAPASPETKPAVPLGMQSVLAAQSPELAPPAPRKPTAPPNAQEKAAMGLNPNEPNAFSEGAQGSRVASAANAFSGSPPPEAVQAEAARQDALASNAFPPPPPGAPAYLPPYTQPAVAMRTPTPAPAPAPAAPQMPTGYVVPASYHPETACSVPQLAAILHDSLFPSQREWAVESLAAMDWRRQPQIVDILVERAKADPAPAVRAECVRSLGRMKADSVASVEAVKALRADADDRVRQAAEEACAVLTGAPNAAPASH